jgi:hypothetical protein
MKRLILLSLLLAGCQIAPSHVRTDPPLPTFRVGVWGDVTQMPGGTSYGVIAYIDIEATDAQAAADAFARAVARAMRHEATVVGTGAQLYGP